MYINLVNKYYIFLKVLLPDLQATLTIINLFVFLYTHCKEKRTPKLERMIMGRRQYPSTLATQPNDTPVILMRLSRQYMPRQPIALMPYT